MTNPEQKPEIPELELDVTQDDLDALGIEQSLKTPLNKTTDIDPFADTSLIQIGHKQKEIHDKDAADARAFEAEYQNYLDSARYNLRTFYDTWKKAEEDGFLELEPIEINKAYLLKNGLNEGTMRVFLRTMKRQYTRNGKAEKFEKNSRGFVNFFRNRMEAKGQQAA